MRPRAAPSAAAAPARPPFRRKYLVEALEPRLLLSADVLPIVPPPPPEPVHDAHPAEAVAAAAGGDAHALPQFHFDATQMAADFAAAVAPDAPPHEAASAPTEIAFVDGRIVGQDALTLQKDGMLVVILDSNQDGLAQISEVLAQNHDITAVHIIAHGDAGEMFLGTSVLNSQAITDGRVADWGGALTEDGDLLLYGCDVAQGAAGQSFVQQLAAATGADVGASTDPTGPTLAGANWMLEYTVGKLEATPLQPTAFSEILATFAGTSGADSFTTGTGNDIYNFASGNLDSGDKIADPSGSDDLVITDAATVIDSDFTQITGIDRLVLGNFTNSLTLGSLAVTAAGTAAGGAMDIVGGTGTDSLSFAGFGSDLVFAFNSDGSIDVKIAGNTRFHVTGVENLTGGTGADTLDYSARTGDVSVDLQTSQATGLTMFGSIETIIGGSGTNTLSGADGASNLFEIQNSGAVIVGALTVQGFNNLQGGAGANTVNTFKFASAGSFAGSITGNGLRNILDYSLYANGVTVDLTLESASETFAGAVAGVSGTVSSDITEVKGSAHDDTITDGGDATTFSGAGGDDTYVFADDFGAGNTVTDSSGDNTITFAGASNGLSVQFNASSITFTESTNTLTATGSFETIEGSDDDDTFLAKANVTVSALVKGGLGDDRFQVEEGSDYAGGVDGGGGGGDVVDYRLRGGVLAASTDNTLENVSGGLLGIEKIQHPYSIFDGINDFFTSLQDGIDQTIGSVDLPLVGNLNDVVGGFVTDLRDFILDPIDAALLVDYNVNAVDATHPTKTTVELIEAALSIDFTSSIPGATTASFGLDVVGAEGDALYRAEAVLILQGVLFHDEVDLDFAAAIPGLNLGVETDGGLTLDLSYDIRLAFGFDFNINKFYFDTDGADNKTDSPSTPSDDDVEINLKLEATLEDQALDDDEFTLLLNLGFLQFEATSYDNSDQKTQDDASEDSPYQDDKHSGFFAEFGIDLKDPGSDPQNVADGWAVNDGIITHNEFKDSRFHLKDNLVAVMSAYADVDLFMRLSADVISGGLPSVQFYFHYDQLFGEAEITFNGEADGTGVAPPEVVLEDLSLDLGSFFTSFLKPVLDEVKVITEPLQPVVDFLKTDIPILSDIDLLKNLLNKDGQGGVDVLDFAGTILGPTKYGTVVTAVNALAELIDLVNHIPDDADTILINFGTYEFGGPSNDLRTGGSHMTVPNTSGYNSGQNIAQNQAISSSTKGFLSSLTRDPVQGGFSVPILTDPAEIIKLITGQTATLVMYDLPQLDFGVNFHKSVPLVFPLNMVLDAGFNVTVRLGFGFDSSGIMEFAQGGYSNPELIFKGFFIDDHGVEGDPGDLDEIHVEAHFTVGASVGVSGIIEAGVQGGITGNFGFDFNDVDSNGAQAGGYDGKIHFNELEFLVQQQGVLGFLDMHGSLDWFLQAFVWVGLDLGFFGKITLYDETFDLGGGNIVTFENHYNVSAIPNVADLDGSGNLVLHMGSDAGKRNDADGGPNHSLYSDLDGSQAETFTVDLSEDGTKYLVSYNGTTEEFAKSSVTGSIIVNDAQGGNDVLTVGEGVTAGLIFHGGDGDDRVSYLGTGTAQIYGDAGNDRLTANSVQHSNANRITVAGQTAKFDTRIEGGTGDDQITLTNVDPDNQIEGNDYVHGGTTGSNGTDSGNDKIKTRGGDDVIFGGNETDLTGGKANGDIIDAGDGNDTIFGGGGSDSIKGGDGDDFIDGGDETVNIVRDANGNIVTASSTGLTAQGKAVGDTIDGGDGNDTIYAGAGFDTIRGGDGVDTIRGGSGDDAITGGAGIDVIFGDGANFSGDGSAATRTGNDTITWSVGDGDDSTVDAGSGNDAVILNGSNLGSTISLTGSGSNVVASWASSSATSTLTLIGVEKATLTAGTGADTLTINDLAATTLREVSINLGSSVQNVTQYDVNGDGSYHALPVPLLDANGHLQTTTDGSGNQQLVYANGTSLTDVPDVLRDQEGHALYTVNDNGTPDDHNAANGDETLDDFQVPVYNDDGVASKIVSQSVIDSSADKVIVNGSSINDGFVLTNTAAAGVASPSYTLTRTNLSTGSTLLSLSVSQGNFATDTLTVNGLDGNDSIDASKVTTGVAELHLDGGTGDDRIIGSQLADKIQGGDGNDTVTGNAGLDVFSDSSGTNDTLVETRDKDFDLASNTLKVGQSSDGETEDVTLFERFTLTGGASANVFSVHDFNKTVVLDGAAGGDQYLITFKGSGSSSITEQDSGGTSGLPDSMKIYGTSGNDTIQSLAVTPTSGTISKLNGTGATPPTEVVRYNVTETLDVDGLGGDDVFSIDDTSMEINFIGNAGNDKFTVGHVETEIVYHDAWLLSSGDLLFVITLDNGKPIHPITGVIDNGATLSNGKWTFSDGFVATTPTIDSVTSQPIDPATGNPDPGAVFYDEINVADKLTNGISYQAFLFGGDGDDSFEVNHNLAEVFLNGEAGNDRFVINANLTNDAQSNISGGDGSNHIEYVQNAKVFIDGGTGFDVVVINGTSIGDTFIITTVIEDLIDEHGDFILDGSGNHVQGEVQKVVGAGLQIGKIANVEQLEVNGGGGPDKIYVYGTLPGMALLVSGGSGDDTIYIGGDTVSVTGVTPAHFEQPPTIPAYDETVITGYQTITVDPPGYYYWDWDSFPYLFFYDPPQYSYLEPIIQVIHHDAVTPPKTLVPAQAYTFTQPAKFEVTGIKGTFSINGEDGNDTVVVNNQDGANTAAATTGSLDLNTVTGSSSSTDYTALSGFGVAAGEKINITNAETLNLNLGAFDDHLTITHTDAALTTNVNLGNGANTVDVTASAGDLNVTGGTGNDKLNLGSLAPTMSGGTLANITGAITFAAGGGSDTLNLDNSSNPALSATVTVNASSISTLNEFGGITSYTGVETLSLNLGAGADTINVTGTSAVTTINANGGNDVINVSSDGAALQGSLDNVAQTLNLHAGTGNNTLNVSDFGDTDADGSVVLTSSSITGLAPAAINYDAVSGRFTGGINLWAGTGNDGVTISSTTLADVTTFYGNAGNDTITVANLTGGSNRFLSIHGDAGDDTIDASAIQALDFTVLLFGDSGQETYSGADKQFVALTAAASVSPATGGTDILKGGSGRGILIGGAGSDTLTTKDSSDVLIGDNGSVQLVSGVVTQLNSTDTNGAGDTIAAAGGANYVIGGVGGDGITALTGTNDVVFGDNGTATFTAGGIIMSAVSADIGSGAADTINVGDGNNVVIGGAGNDTITTLDGTDVVIGDNGSATWTSGVLTQFKSSDLGATTGGDDTIGVGNGRNFVIGGVGVDNTTAGSGDDVVLGDNGIVNFVAGSGVIKDAATTQNGLGGGENLSVGDGNNVVIGGAGNDVITSLGGTDVVIGDNGSAAWNAGLVTQIQTSDTSAATGGDDSIDAGNGKNLVLAGVGADTVATGSGDDVVVGDNGGMNFVNGLISSASVSFPVGDVDVINAGAGNNVVLGGVGGDTITTLGGSDVVIADEGYATWTAGVLTSIHAASFASAIGDDDVIDVGGGVNYVAGGIGSDNISSGADDDVVLGDDGDIGFDGTGSLLPAGSLLFVETSAPSVQGGNDVIDTGAGNNTILGGTGGDSITASVGNDMVIGDSGVVMWMSFSGGSGYLMRLSSWDTVSVLAPADDTISVGDGENYVIGGAGADQVTTGGNDDVVIGDIGLVTLRYGSEVVDAAAQLLGVGGADTLTVGGGNNVVLAGDGNDIVTALDGRDVVIGDHGQATWTAGVLTQFKSTDTVSTTGGNDSIDVGNGDNCVIGGVGADGIDGGAGNDVVLGDSGVVNFTPLGVITDATITNEGTGGSDTIDVGGGDNVVLAGDGGDDVTALDGTDVVIGDNGNAIWTGGVLTSFTSANTGVGGDDTINIGTTAATAGRNYAIGGVGQDTITGGENDDVVLGDNGVVHFTPGGVITDATVLQIGTGDLDTIDVRGGNNVVLAGAGGDSVSAGSGTDVIIGDNGAATWTGAVLTHFASSDSSATTGGSDTINAGDGDNYVIGGVGNDVIDAGTGNDVVLGDSGEVNFTSTGVITDATITTEGTGGDDTIDVDGGNNVALAGDGVDAVTALDGEDVVIGDNGQATWIGGTLTTLTSNNTGVGGDDTINVGTVAATAGKNYVIGGIGRDTITGGQNDDVVLGDNGIVHFTAGGVIMDASVLQIGTGDADTIDVRGGNNVVLAGTGGDSVMALGGLDVVIGDNGQAIWTGGVLTRFETTDLVAATGGDDTIDVGDGDNYVIGGVGKDGINAGTGNDVVLGDSGIVNFTSAGVITDATINTEGSGGDDTIDVAGGNNVVLAGDGEDSVTALDGMDVVIGDNGNAAWSGGVLTSFTSANTGAGGDDTINIGTIAATAGRNYAIGGVGQDTITGGENDDVVLGDNGIVHFTSGGVITDATVTEIGTGEVDTIDVRGGNNVVLAGAGGDSVSAGSGTDVIIGDNGSATWSGGIVTQIRSGDSTAATGGDDTIAAGDGRNYVIGGVGADGITSGSGNDVVLGDNGEVNFTSTGVITDANATELGLGGIDTIDAGGGHNVIIGGAQGDTVTSGAGNDVVLGDNGRLTFAAGVLADAVTTDTTDATGGNDTITAGGGNNVVLAGVGNDQATTGGGNDVIIGDNGIAQFDAAGLVSMVEARDPLRIGDDTINAGDGNDVVIGGGGADTIFGEGGDDVLIGDGGTANFLGGSVTLVIGDVSYGAADFVDSGPGNDILLGGAGDDTLVANLTDDLFTGGNARISFSGGLVTTIEILDGVDLVMQQLFDSFTAPQQESVVIEEAGSAGGELETPIGTLLTDSIGAEGIFASDGTALLPGHNALTFSFGRPVPLSQVPELLRNIVLELSLGAGVPPPAHAGESGGQGQPPAEGSGGGGGAPSNTGSPQDDAEQPEPSGALPFALEDEASTLAPESTAEEAPVAALAAAAIAGLARPAPRPVLERDAFAPRRIDW